MNRTYDIDFAMSHIPLNEHDIDFGIQYGLVDTHGRDRLTDLFPVEDLPQKWSDSHEKWRLAALLWAVENHADSLRDLFDEVDTIWADFHEPQDMSHLVSFMPSNAPDPSYEKLERAIYDFVSKKRNEIGCHELR